MNPHITHRTDDFQAARRIDAVIEYFPGPDGSVHALVKFADHTTAEAAAKDITIPRTAFFAAA